MKYMITRRIQNVLGMVWVQGLLLACALFAESGQASENKEGALADAQTVSKKKQVRRPAVSSGRHIYSLTHQDRKRSYLVYVPKSCEPTRSIPVVFIFHGGGGTGKGTLKQTGMDKKAEEAGFLAVFPEGSRPKPDRPAMFGLNPQLWNDGRGYWFVHDQKIDDVGFTAKMIDDLVKRFNVDERRVYATGFSNGAALCYRLGLELSERITAIAPVASYCWLQNVTPKRAVPLLYIVGREDPRTLFKGGFVGTGRKKQKKPAVHESLAVWAKATGRPVKPESVQKQNGVTVERYNRAKNGSEMSVYIIDGMGHTWPGGRRFLPKSLVGETTDKLKANDVIWSFFEKQTL